MMREAGLDARIDALGTVIGRLEGTDPAAPAILIGSHIDSVVDAGPLRRQSRGRARHRRRRGAARARDPARLPDRGPGVRRRGERALPDEPLDLRTRCRAATIRPGSTSRDGGRHQLCGTPSWPSAAIRRASPPSRAVRSAAAPISRVHIEQGPLLEAEAVPVGVVVGHQRHHPGPGACHRRGRARGHRADGPAPRCPRGGGRDDRGRRAHGRDAQGHGRDRRRRRGASRAPST